MKCAVIGMGGVARHHYLPALGDEHDVEIACLARDASAAAEAVAAAGATLLRDIDELAAWRPDVAFVLTTDTQHVAVIDQLIDIGVPRIFVEKPLAAAHGQGRIDSQDVADGERLVAAAVERGIDIAVGYNYRHFATVVRAREELERRGWGAAAGVIAATHYACLSHVIDLIGVFVGDVAELTSLEGKVEHGPDGARLADRVTAFTAVDGATGVLRVSSAQPWGDSLFDLTIAYAEGSIRIMDLDGTLELYDARDGRRETSRPGDERSRADGYGGSFATSIHAYLETVRAGAVPPSSGVDGVRELRFHAAVERSLREGRPVAVSH